MVSLILLKVLMSLIVVGLWRFILLNRAISFIPETTWEVLKSETAASPTLRVPAFVLKLRHFPIVPISRSFHLLCLSRVKNINQQQFLPFQPVEDAMNFSSSLDVFNIIFMPG